MKSKNDDMAPPAIDASHALTLARPAMLSVRLTTKATNAILASLVDRVGSIKAAAQLVGVSQNLFGKWLSFRSCPSGAHFHRFPKKYTQVVIALERETGRSIYDIFPELPPGAKEMLTRKRVVTNEVSMVQLTKAIEQSQATYTIEAIGSNGVGVDARENIEQVLKSLTYREREIVCLRYGLHDGCCYTLREVAERLCLSADRVRQLEMKAIWKLQQPHRASQLVSHLEDTASPTALAQLDAEFKKRQQQTLAERFGITMSGTSGERIDDEDRG